MAALDECMSDWDELEKEYQALEETHKQYCKKVNEVKAIQAKCMSGISHQRYRTKRILEAAKESCLTVEDRARYAELQQSYTERKTHFRELEETLPHENGYYLKVILGSVNVSLLSKQDKFKYKDNYEMFKLYVTVISMLVAMALWCLPKYRVLDAVFQFLLVWYYCTITIREHILKVNGSRIKGWWITHHFISTFCAAVLLIWPDSYSYRQFHDQFVVFSLYTCTVQVAQFYYQRGCLYRLRSLGERHNMDLTVEGFGSWMWKGLGFLVPFLIVGYLFQFYNAYSLYKLSQHELCKEWQVGTLAIVFFALFVGNTVTTMFVFRQKYERFDMKKQLEYIWRNKYKFQQYIVDSTSHVVRSRANSIDSANMPPTPAQEQKTAETAKPHES